jgi:uncharacterized membrane protein YfcA
MILSIQHFGYLLMLLPLVAFLYASVGHGGASGYLALMALFSVAPETMKPTALLLNLFVAGIAFFHYYRNGHFNRKLFLAFAITSIPAAFLGGLIDIETGLYKKILAVLLVFAIIRMLPFFNRQVEETKEVKMIPGLVLGAFIGFFSGLIGIGGGIVLTPVILLLHWGNMKEAAAVSALFIWVNSAAGLTGQFISGVQLSSYAFIMVVVAVAGGFLGSYYGSKKFNNQLLRYLLAVVLSIACFKLFFT